MYVRMCVSLTILNGVQNFNSRTACSSLLNLCTLHGNNEDSSPCQLFESLVNTRTDISNGFTNWKQTLPFRSFDDDSVLQTNVLKATFKLRQVEEVGHA